MEILLRNFNVSLVSAINEVAGPWPDGWVEAYPFP